MHTIFVNETIDEDLLYEQPERTSDIQLPPIINTLLLVAWIVIFLIGLAAIYIVKSPLLGALIIAIPTFIGMIIKPTFALCMMMLVLPTGAGIGYSQIFSLDRGIGIALAVSFLLNLMISRPSLHVYSKTLFVLILYTIWIFLSSLAAPYLSLEIRRAFTQFQLLALVFIVYWILQTNGEKAFRWALRSYVIGTLGTIAIAYKSGAAMVTMEEQSGRYSATLGTAINANMMSVLLGLAFLTAVYLLVCDKRIFWRIINLVAIVSLPLMVLRTGSRGGAVALVFTILSPFLFLRQVVRRPVLVVLMMIIITFAAGSTMFFVKSRGLEESVESRLTDVQYAKQGVNRRIALIKSGIEAARKYPAGTGFMAYLQRTGQDRFPHNDFVFALGVHGIPAAILYVVFVIMMIFNVKRMPLGIEKLYVRSVLIFLLVSSLDVTQLYRKHFWVFIAVILASKHLAELRASTDKLLLSAGYDEDMLIQD